MKTFQDLTEAKQTEAIEAEAAALLNAICAGAIRFNDQLNEDNLQKRIDAAAKKADRMKTPWFIGEYIMDTCREEIMGMAQCSAEDALYPEADDRIGLICAD
jgi:hypothetical protein